ncbi:MAG TPA: PPC domain-containing protein [Myxococcota bacterium]|nr:PPC domain-containing protein [Myxococcota bacterium]
MPLLLIACLGMDTLVQEPRGEGRPPLGGATDLDTSEAPDTGLQNNGDKEPQDTDEQEEPPKDNNPVITAFAASEEDSKVRFTFGLEDPDEDLGGGEVTVECDGTEVRYDYPGEMRWTDGGSPFVLWELDDFVPEEKVTCRIQATDGAGNAAEPKTTTFTRANFIREITEGGDTQGTSEGIGRIPVPATIRGSMYGTGNNGYAFTEDIDFVKFSVEDTGSREFTLNWTETSADYDLYLLVSGAETLAASATYDYPESLTYELQADTTYFFAVAGWSGPPGDWTLRIE